MYHQASRFPERAQKFPKFVLGIGILTLTFWMVAYLMFPALLKFTEEQAEKEDEGAENRFPLLLGMVLHCRLHSGRLSFRVHVRGPRGLPELWSHPWREREMGFPDDRHVGPDALLLRRLLSDPAYSGTDGRVSEHRPETGCDRMSRGRLVAYGAV